MRWEEPTTRRPAPVIYADDPLLDWGWLVALQRRLARWRHQPDPVTDVGVELVWLARLLPDSPLQPLPPAVARALLSAQPFERAAPRVTAVIHHYSFSQYHYLRIGTRVDDPSDIRLGRECLVIGLQPFGDAVLVGLDIDPDAPPPPPFDPRDQTSIMAHLDRQRWYPDALFQLQPSRSPKLARARSPTSRA